MNTPSREVADGSTPTVLEAPTALHLRTVQFYGVAALGSVIALMWTLQSVCGWLGLARGPRVPATPGEVAVAALVGTASAALAFWSFRCIRAGGRAAGTEAKISAHALRLPVFVRMRGRLRLVIDDHGLELRPTRSVHRIRFDEIAAVDWDTRGVQLRLRNGAFIEVPLARPPRGSLLRTTFHEIDVITRSIALAALGFNERIATLISQLATSSGRPYRSRQLGAHR
jgi:hypothetical protein